MEKGTGKIVRGFKVEKSTSIYSGILRLTDLSISLPQDLRTLVLVIPDGREKEVKVQLKRPSLHGNNVPIRYILCSELREHCDAICKFGSDHEAMNKIARTP